MDSSESQQKYFKRRYADDPQFRAGRLEANARYKKQWGMTGELGRFYDVMRRCGWTPACDGAAGRPS